MLGSFVNLDCNIYACTRLETYANVCSTYFVVKRSVNVYGDMQIGITSFSYMEFRPQWYRPNFLMYDECRIEQFSMHQK